MNGISGINERTLLYLKQKKSEVIRLIDLKKNYEELLETIDDIGKKLTHEIMVPIGENNLAFMNGKLVHTNEIMVFLGSDYFVKVNSSHAEKIIRRRIKHLNDSVRNINNEIEKIYEQCGFKIEKKSDEVVNIVEKLEDDDEILKPKKKNKKKKKPIRKKKVDITDQNADLDDILDQLEEEEKEEEEKENRKNKQIEETEGEEEEEKENITPKNLGSILSEQEKIRISKHKERKKEFFKYYTKKTSQSPSSSSSSSQQKQQEKKKEKRKKLSVGEVVFDENPSQIKQQQHTNTNQINDQPPEKMSLFMRSRYGM